MTILLIDCNAFGKHGGNYELNGREVGRTSGESNSGKTNSRPTAAKNFGLSHFGQRQSGHHSVDSQTKSNGIKTSSKVSEARSPISIAVQTRRTVQVIPVQVEEEGDIEPQIIEIESSSLPLQLNFRSQSSRLTVHQSHTPSTVFDITIFTRVLICLK